MVYFFPVSNESLIESNIFFNEENNIQLETFCFSFLEFNHFSVLAQGPSGWIKNECFFRSDANSINGPRESQLQTRNSYSFFFELCIWYAVVYLN